MGRAKLENVLLGSKSSRKECFNKRCRGVFKKIYELAHISGAGVRLIIEGEDGNIYDFHRRMSPALLCAARKNDVHDETMAPLPHDLFEDGSGFTLAPTMGSEPGTCNTNLMTMKVCVDGDGHGMMDDKESIPMSYSNISYNGARGDGTNNPSIHDPTNVASAPSYNSTTTSYDTTVLHHGYWNGSHEIPTATGLGSNASLLDSFYACNNVPTIDNMSSNHVLPRRLLLPSPSIGSARTPSKPTNRYMFYNGGRTMLDTGLSVTFSLRRHLSPEFCNCFDCTNGYSMRFFETIVTDHSLPPLHGDDRSFFQKVPFMGNAYIQIWRQEDITLDTTPIGPLEPNILHHQNPGMMQPQFANVEGHNAMPSGCEDQLPNCDFSTQQQQLGHGTPILPNVQLSRALTMQDNNLGTNANMELECKEEMLPMIDFPDYGSPFMVQSYDFPPIGGCFSCGRDNCDDIESCLTENFNPDVIFGDSKQ